MERWREGRRERRREKEGRRERRRRRQIHGSRSLRPSREKEIKQQGRGGRWRGNEGKRGEGRGRDKLRARDW